MNEIHIESFMEKIKEDFGIKIKKDTSNNFTLYFNDFLVLKLLIRKNCWYRVWREDPELDNKWRAYRIHNAQEENEVYNHVREFVKINSQC